MNTRFIRLLASLVVLVGAVASRSRAADLARPPAGDARGAVAGGGGGATTPGAAVDLRRRPLDEIAPGTVIGESSAQGWSHLVLIATPRLGVGDVNAIPRTA